MWHCFFKVGCRFFWKSCARARATNWSTAISWNPVKRTTRWLADQVVPHWERNFPNGELLCPCCNDGPLWAETLTVATCWIVLQHASRILAIGTKFPAQRTAQVSKYSREFSTELYVFERWNVVQVCATYLPESCDWNPINTLIHFHRDQVVPHWEKKYPDRDNGAEVQKKCRQPCVGLGRARRSRNFINNSIRLCKD